MTHFYSNPKSAVRDCLNERRDLERQLAKEGEKPILDWPLVKGMLRRQIAVSARCSTAAGTHFLELLDRLPASDQAKFFRSLHPGAMPPIPITIRPSAPDTK